MIKSSKKKVQLPDDKSVIARCYLTSKSEADQISLITPFWIYFIVKNKNWRFENDNITNISIGHHKLMGPLIIGGLISCFTIILISRNEFDPFLLLTGFVGGLVLLYHGWSGSEAITIQEKNDSTIIFLKEIPDACSTFLKFHRNYLTKRDQAMSIFHIANRKEWETDESEYSHPSLNSENFIHSSTKDQVIPTFAKHFSEDGDFILLEIDIPQLVNEVKYEFAPERGELFPHIYGIINKSAVTRTFPFRNLTDLKNIVFKL